MLRDLELKTNDWSVNLEDEEYANDPDWMLEQALVAILRTAPGHAVNLVTPGSAGHPEQWFIGELQQQLTKRGVAVIHIRFVDECGCGGYVTRVYR